MSIIHLNGIETPTVTMTVTEMKLLIGVMKAATKVSLAWQTDSITSQQLSDAHNNLFEALALTKEVMA